MLPLFLIHLYVCLMILGKTESQFSTVNRFVLLIIFFIFFHFSCRVNVSCSLRTSSQLLGELMYLLNLLQTVQPQDRPILPLHQILVPSKKLQQNEVSFYERDGIYHQPLGNWTFLRCVFFALALSLMMISFH